MNFSEAITPYTDETGLVHPDISHSSQNGLTYLGYTLALKSVLGELNHFDSQNFKVAVSKCSLRPGLIARLPGLTYQQSFDDYQGVICGATLTKSYNVIADVLEFGRNNHLKLGPFKFKYFYNTDRPYTQVDRSGIRNWSAWFGRFPMFRLLVKLLENPRSILYNHIGFNMTSVIKALTANHHDDHAWMFLFVTVEAFGTKGLKAQLTIIMRDRGMTFKKAFAQYFGTKHPITDFIPDEPWAHLV